MANTSIDYCMLVRQKYEYEKSKKYEGFLLEPTPAGLRELCLIFFDKGLNKKDEEVFANFFKPKEEKGLKRAIEKFDVEKFRPVCNFLKGKSKSTNNTILNLLAVLVDLDCRPFSKFIHNGKIEVEDRISNYKKELNVVKNEKKSKSVFKKKIGIGILGLIGIFSASYTAKDIIFPKKECMIWENDHYEAIDCNSQIDQFANFADIKPFNKNEFYLKRIIPTNKTIFFINGRPQVFYCKVTSDSLDYFNSHGFHPVNGKQLHGVSKYIIKKYIINKE